MAKKKAKKARDSALNDLVPSWIEQYRAAGEPWPTDRRTLASWFIRKGLWEPTRKSAIDILAPLVSRAMREEMVTDPQGRRVRKKHAIPHSITLPDGTHEQLKFWVDRDDATPQQMRAAFALRRRQNLGDNWQLKQDVDSFNDNNKYGAHIQMSFDYTDDLEEMEHPTEYEGLEESK